MQNTQLLVPKVNEPELDKAKKRANLANNILTGASIAAAAGIAAGANEAIKNDAVKKAGKNINKAASKIVNNVKDQLGKLKQNNLVNTVITTAGNAKNKVLGAKINKKTVRDVIKGAGSRVGRLFNSVNKYVNGMGVRVKISAGAGIALLTAAGVYRAGQIKGQDEGIKAFSKASENAANAIKSFTDWLADVFDGEENQKSAQQIVEKRVTRQVETKVATTEEVLQKVIQ